MLSAYQWGRFAFQAGLKIYNEKTDRYLEGAYPFSRKHILATSPIYLNDTEYVANNDEYRMGYFDEEELAE